MMAIGVFVIPETSLNEKGQIFAMAFMIPQDVSEVNVCGLF
jgi:aromatic ring hydroxylase